MISVEAWRRAIGGFCHPRAARLLCKAETTSLNQDYTLSARMVVMSLTLWILCAEINILNFIQDGGLANERLVTDCFLPVSPGITNTHICLSTDHSKLFAFDILLRSGIESNPGPESDDLNKLADIKDQMLNEIRDLRNCSQTMRNEMSTMKKEIEGLRQMKTDIDKNAYDIKGSYAYSDEAQSTCIDEVNLLKSRVKELEVKMEKQEVYSRRENVLLKGVPEEQNEDAMKKVIDILNTSDTNDKLTPSDFQRVHRVGRKEQGRHRPIIARFVLFNKKMSAIKVKEEVRQKRVIAYIVHCY